jgi:hypothetical protein
MHNCYISILTQYSAGAIYRRVEKNPGAELEVPRSVPFNIDAAYAVGGGTPHCQFITLSLLQACFGDRIVDRGSYVRQCTSTSTSSSTHSSHAADSVAKERD